MTVRGGCQGFFIGVCLLRGKEFHVAVNLEINRTAVVCFSPDAFQFDRGSRTVCFELDYVVENDVGNSVVVANRIDCRQRGVAGGRLGIDVYIFYFLMGFMVVFTNNLNGYQIFVCGLDIDPAPGVSGKFGVLLLVEFDRIPGKIRVTGDLAALRRNGGGFSALARIVSGSAFFSEGNDADGSGDQCQHQDQ